MLFTFKLSFVSVRQSFIDAETIWPWRKQVDAQSDSQKKPWAKGQGTALQTIPRLVYQLEWNHKCELVVATCFTVQTRFGSFLKPCVTKETVMFESRTFWCVMTKQHILGCSMPKPEEVIRMRCSSQEVADSLELCWI